MNGFIDFISEYFYVYLWLITTTFINVIAPMAGSVVVNPVTAFFTDPQRAIGIGAFIFACTGIHRVHLFKKEILSDAKNLAVIKKILPYSVIGAVMGGFLISYLNTQILVIVIISVSLYFIYKTLIQILHNVKIDKEPNHFSQISSVYSLWVSSRLWNARI